MVEKINTQNTWRQVTFTNKAKKVKQRKQKNKDKSFQNNLQEEENKKGKQKEQKDKNLLKSEGNAKKIEGSGAENSKKKESQKNLGQNDNSQRKLIDIVV
jgi:hypothetical protein